jgi:TetR/AcrR family transcriptional repressor of nem operon
MPDAGGQRARLKHESLGRVLDAAAGQIRRGGLSGASIAAVMAEAGLTHGAFYAHFDSKEELEAAAFAHAIQVERPRWVPRRRSGQWDRRLTRIAQRYLTVAHRDDLTSSCAFPLLVSDAAHAGAGFRAAYEQAIRGSQDAICGDEADIAARREDALALMIICVGGMSLSRAVADEEFSAQILRVARRTATRLAQTATP